MRKVSFTNWLAKTTLSEKGIANRICRLECIERKYKVDIDTLVLDDEAVFLFLTRLSHDNNNKHYSNAFRVYYKFVKGKDFPKLNEYLEVKYGKVNSL